MVKLWLLHQNRRADRYFYKPENVVAALFGAIRADLGADHHDNRNRQKALARLLKLTDDAEGLSYGIAGHVWKVEADERALETMPEDAPPA